MPLRKISADEFARRLKDTSRESDKRFAFFLGAGCSVTSDIPAAGGLVRDHWLPRLKGYRAPHRHNHDDWVREELPEYDSNNPGACYGAVMEKLFFQPEERQREIERLCDGKFPGFGYATLASLMAMERGTFNVVLTTNFDDLVADALYLFTKARPLIIHHESLASYIRPTRTRPLIVKLHGDNRLTPRNTSEETQRLQTGIENQVRPVLNDRGLIFIGYGGNDESIARMLEELPPEALPLGVYWVSGQEPNCRLRTWLDDRNATWVEKGDFDELMLLVRDVFELPHPEKKRFEEVFERYATTYKVLSKRITALPDAAPEASALKEAVKRTDQSFPNWWAVELEASRLEKDDPDQADETYRRGLSQFPSSAPLLGNYALFLETVRKDYDGAEEHYRRALIAEPEDADLLGNYALFLENIRKNYYSAEEHYRRALAADSNHANNLGNYAIFLENVGKNYDGAEEHYRRALAVDFEHVTNLSSYAVFLESVRKNYDGAEEHYERALVVDSGHAQTLLNYALFLEHIRKDHDGAEEHYKRALASEPNDASSLRNYALFLQTIREDNDGAEQYYRRALAQDPLSPYWLVNYAQFLHDVREDCDGAEEYYRLALGIDGSSAYEFGCYAQFLQRARGDSDSAEEHYRRALAAEPSNAYWLGDFAFFLQDVRMDYEGAEEFFERSLAANPESAHILGSYAVFLEKIRNDYDRAEEHYKRALQVDPDDPTNLGNYGDLLEWIREDYDGAEKYYQRALAADPEHVYTLGNYAVFLQTIRKQYRAAMEHYQRAIAAGSENKDEIANCAGLLLASERDAEGLALIGHALGLLDDDDRPELRLQLFFYLTVNGPTEQEAESLASVKRLLEAGHRSLGRDFSLNIERAKREARTDCEWLEPLAAVIADDSDLSSLEEWGAWHMA